MAKIISKIRVINVHIRNTILLCNLRVILFFLIEEQTNSIIYSKMPKFVRSCIFRKSTQPLSLTNLI